MAIEVRLSQCENAESPMAVTLGGMVIEVRLLQLKNASLPIVVTLGGMVMEVRREHPSYLLLVDYQYYTF